MNEPGDVPSAIDLTSPADAAEWARTAMMKRPWRREFFDCFTAQISRARAARVLELGSGPGFLAFHLLSHLPGISLVMLDSSVAMHALGQARLGPLVCRAILVERNFKAPDWPIGLGTFDCVVTHQAVHELRHKRNAGLLHQQVRSVLAAGGQYLVCDHYVGPDGMADRQLYMTVEEQREALLSAGFSSVSELKRTGGLVLHEAT